MAEEKLRRKIRAEAALGSLFVGAPLAGAKSAKDRVSYTVTGHPLLLVAWFQEQPSHSVQEER